MPSFFYQRLQYVWSASSTISRHLVKSILDGSLYLGPLLNSDRNPLSGKQPNKQLHATINDCRLKFLLINVSVLYRCNLPAILFCSIYLIHFALASYEAPEPVLSTDLLSFEHPSVLPFCPSACNMLEHLSAKISEQESHVLTHLFPTHVVSWKSRYMSHSLVKMFSLSD